MCPPKIKIPPPPPPPPPAPDAPQASALAISALPGSKSQVKGLDLLRIPVKPMSNINMSGYGNTINV